MLFASLCTSQKVLLRSAVTASKKKAANNASSAVRNYSAGQQTGWCLCCGTPSFLCSPVKHGKVSSAESWNMLRSSKAHISTAQSKLNPYSAGESAHMLKQSRDESSVTHRLEQARSQGLEKQMVARSQSSLSNAASGSGTASGSGSGSGSGKDRRRIFLADTTKGSKHLNQILEGNKAWQKDKKENHPEYFARLSRKQTPKFMYVGCSDSRVPANDILGLG
jgi:hypothetical protein